MVEGSYDFVADDMFNGLDVDGFFMEWDDERSGGFEPLRFVPAGKKVVLGLVTTKRGENPASPDETVGLCASGSRSRIPIGRHLLCG